MQAILPLGNDIVDLRLPDNLSSAANHRYIDRVIASEERDSPTFFLNNSRVLWAYWAAKEAAYKSWVKTQPDLVFAHRRFLVYPDSIDSLSRDSGNASGVVQHGNRRVPVNWEWNTDWIHCLTGPVSHRPLCRIGALEDYISRDSFKEMKKATGRLSDASIVVRLLAKSLLDNLGMQDARIVRAPSGRRYGPPAIEQHGELMTDLDISLSHDGRYAAAAVCKLG